MTPTAKGVAGPRAADGEETLMAEHVGSEERLRKFTVRELSRQTSDVLSFVHSTNRPAVITRRGLPAFLILSIDEDDLTASVVRKAAAGVIQTLDEADRLINGGQVKTFEEVLQKDERHNHGTHRTLKDIYADVPDTDL